VILADPPHPNQRNNLSESPSLGLDHGECALPKQLDNHPGLPHIALREQEMTHLVSTTSGTNQKKQMTKDAAWKEFTQTNLKAIDPKLDDS